MKSILINASMLICMLLFFQTSINAQSKPDEASLIEFEGVFSDYKDLIVDSYPGAQNHIIVLDYSVFDVSQGALTQFINATDHAIGYEFIQEGMVNIEVNSVMTSKLYLLHEVFYKNDLRL